MKTLQRTLTIIKPDAVRKNGIGDIIEQFEKQGFQILCLKMLEISKHQAEQFYAVHAGKPFYNSLTSFMSSGPIVALALEKENAIADLRKLMGATNPANAEEGTIRKKWPPTSKTMLFTVPTPRTRPVSSLAFSLPDTNWHSKFLSLRCGRRELSGVL